ncbi:sensor histidine kinase [Ruania albidiflava]|uniref:sensor histidine kinase n=1 Tax=Ruania albidiflava TaxID=366586 RepID=UPI0003B475D7|nr:histidine kinase [Ruania albidiflava]
MIRTTLMRGAWLMLGAAIGLAAGVLGAVLAVSASGGTDLRDGLAWGLLAVLLVGAGVGLLPGVREIQVTAARTLLSVGSPLLAESRSWAHRSRSAAWTVLHALAGLSTGFCVLGLLPGAAVTFWALGQDRLDLLEPVGLGATWWSALLGGLAMLVATVAGPALAGGIAVRLAPVLLGPTAADRLALAEHRLAAERRHTVLARELHDGIGHALSIIGIQAAAASRVVSAHPDRAAGALQAIESTARDAQAELDHLLGLLRDPQTPPARSVREDLPTLLAKHRTAGLTIEVHQDHGRVPRLVWDAMLDILAEALTNAHRHGEPGAVSVAITQDDRSLRLQVDNPAAAAGHDAQPSGGRGILGMQERAALLDGTVRAGASAHSWRVEALLPAPATEETTR